MQIFYLFLVFASFSLFAYTLLPILTKGGLEYRKSLLSLAKKEAQFHFSSGETEKSVRKALMLSIILALLAGILFNSVLAAIAVCAVSFVLPKITNKSKRKKRVLLLETQLPEAAQRMADSVKAGLGLKAAIQETALRCGSPFADEAAHALRETELGVPLVESLNRLAQRISSTEYTTFCASIAIAQETGGSLSSTLDSFASSIRERRVLEGRIRSLTAQGKMQGFVLALLPVIMLGAVYLLDPQMVKPLFETAIGQIMVAAAIILEIAGVFAIRKIISIEI
jgi:tight adherence protein B